jgi:hypothetical protein
VTAGTIDEIKDKLTIGLLGRDSVAGAGKIDPEQGVVASHTKGGYALSRNQVEDPGRVEGDTLEVDTKPVARGGTTEFPVSRCREWYDQPRETAMLPRPHL